MWLRAIEFYQIRSRVYLMSCSIERQHDEAKFSTRGTKNRVVVPWHIQHHSRRKYVAKGEFFLTPEREVTGEIPKAQSCMTGEAYKSPVICSEQLQHLWAFSFKSSACLQQNWDKGTQEQVTMCIRAIRGVWALQARLQCMLTWKEALTTCTISISEFLACCWRTVAVET